LNTHQPNEEEAFRQARKNLTNIILKIFGFGGGFCLALIFVILNGLQVHYVTTHRGVSGPSSPILIILIFTGLVTIFSIPDLKQAWREYQKARQRHTMAKTDSDRKTGEHE
jgi:hypothetical protein